MDKCNYMYKKTFTFYYRKKCQYTIKRDLDNDCIMELMSQNILRKKGVKNTLTFIDCADEDNNIIYVPLTEKTPIYFKYIKYKIYFEAEHYVEGLDDYVRDQFNLNYNCFDQNTSDTFENFMDVLKGAQDCDKYIDQETAFKIISYYYYEYGKPNAKIVSKLARMSLCDLVSHEYRYGTFMNDCECDFCYQIPTDYFYDVDSKIDKSWQSFKKKFVLFDKWFSLDQLEWFTTIVTTHFDSLEKQKILEDFNG